jgi:hypothetical protein
VELHTLSAPRVAKHGMRKLFHNAVEKAVEKIAIKKMAKKT